MDQLLIDILQQQMAIANIHINEENKVEDVEFPLLLTYKKASNFFVNDELIKFNNSDNIIVPPNIGNKLMSLSLTLYSAKLTNEDKFTYGRVVKYSAEENSIIIPDWMAIELQIEHDTQVNFDILHLNKITNIKISCPSYVTNPIAILHFELRNFVVLYAGMKVKTKIFDKEIEITLTEVIPDNVGFVDGSDVKIDV
uniref:Ubiquitin fusion degradation protein UFD1 N-terminal subdomain 1 domain-containing protein n=1 Tax=viral metagenome TaxID=1070528 RepID=A0A6C0E9N9_9ZZZZ